MSYAAFPTQTEAQAYADAVHDALLDNQAYIAERWSVPVHISGTWYVDAHDLIPADTIVPSLPSVEAEP